MKIETCMTPAGIGQKASQHGARAIKRAISARGEANIILATGASQFSTLTHLAQYEGIHWPAVTVFHLDEYIGLPISSPASFRLYLWQRFVSKLPMPLKAFHYIDGETDPEAECERLSAIIQRHPIDVAFIGIGENGHLAFNDPPADFETTSPYIIVELDPLCRQQQVGEGWFDDIEEVPARAISMSVYQILKSREIIVSVPGEQKARAVQQSIERPYDPRYPATALRNHQRAFLYLDTSSSCMLAHR